MTLLRRLRLLLALAAGLALALAFPPYAFTPLAWISIAALILVSLGARWWKAALCGLLHGAGFYAASLTWIYTVMRVHGGLEPLPAAGVLALMVFTLSLFTAAFALAVNWLGRASVGRACLAAPFLWVALEFGREYMPYIGFPWNLLGYAASSQLGLLQLASLTGIYGLSFLLASYNALFVWLLVERTRRGFLGWLVATAILIPAAVMGQRFLPMVFPRQTAHLVQMNIPQVESYPADWMERMAPDLDEIERMSIDAAKQRPGLIVWPEVPAPFYLQDPKFAARATRIAREGDNYFLVGIVDWKPEANPQSGGTQLVPYNSAALLDPAGQRVFSYDKIHLVAFGEYVPLRKWLSFAEKMTAEVGDFRAGSNYAVGQLPATGTSGRTSGKFGVVICFEAVFPNLVRKFVAGGAELLVNISNDGWFAHSGALEQHVAMARVRAVENRRWLLRATNTGLTTVVDPYGRFTAQLAPDRRDVLTASYDFRSDLTLYSRWGDWLAWLSLIASAVFLVVGALHAAPAEKGRGTRSSGDWESRKQHAREIEKS